MRRGWGRCTRGFRDSRPRVAHAVAPRVATPDSRLTCSPSCSWKFMWEVPFGGLGMGFLGVCGLPRSVCAGPRRAGVMGLLVFFGFIFMRENRYACSPRPRPVPTGSPPPHCVVGYSLYCMCALCGLSREYETRVDAPGAALAMALASPSAPRQDERQDIASSRFIIRYGFI